MFRVFKGKAKKAGKPSTVPAAAPRSSKNKRGKKAGQKAGQKAGKGRGIDTATHDKSLDHNEEYVNGDSEASRKQQHEKQQAPRGAPSSSRSSRSSRRSSRSKGEKAVDKSQTERKDPANSVRLLPYVPEGIDKDLEKPFKELYSLGKVVGSGSFSVVREGRDRTTGDHVAVKCIKKRRLNRGDLEGLKHEIAILKEINHENIIRLHGFFQDQIYYYLVTDFMPGGHLFDRIVEAEYFTEQDAQRIVRTLGEALQYCHVRGIVHRDLKPENILLSSEDDDATIKIADFGFAKKTQMDIMGQTLNSLSTALGTPGYVAPEVISGKPYGPSVDMWSIGVIAYIMLCGYPPFYSETDNDKELFAQIRKGAFEFDSPYWDKISQNAKDLISELLCVDPKKRMTVDEMLDHPWVAENSREENSNTDITPALAELRKYQERQRWTVGAMPAVINNSMTFGEQQKLKHLQQQQHKALNNKHASVDGSAASSSMPHAESSDSRRVSAPVQVVGTSSSKRSTSGKLKTTKASAATMTSMVAKMKSNYNNNNNDDDDDSDRNDVNHPTTGASSGAGDEFDPEQDDAALEEYLHEAARTDPDMDDGAAVSALGPVSNRSQRGSLGRGSRRPQSLLLTPIVPIGEDLQLEDKSGSCSSVGEFTFEAQSQVDGVGSANYNASPSGRMSSGSRQSSARVSGSWRHSGSRRRSSTSSTSSGKSSGRSTAGGAHKSVLALSQSRSNLLPPRKLDATGSFSSLPSNTAADNQTLYSTTTESAALVSNNNAKISRKLLGRASSASNASTGGIGGFGGNTGASTNTPTSPRAGPGIMLPKPSRRESHQVSSSPRQYDPLPKGPNTLGRQKPSLFAHKMPSFAMRSKRGLLASDKAVAKAYFSVFAPHVYPGNVFVIDIWAYALQSKEIMRALAKTQPRDQGKKGPLRLELGEVVTIKLVIPKKGDGAFKLVEKDGAEDEFEWDGQPGNASFVVSCEEAAAPRKYAFQATISCQGQQRGTLLFNVTVLKPTSELDMAKRTPADIGATLTLLPETDSGYHVFLSHRPPHRDVAVMVKKALKKMGYSVFMRVGEDQSGEYPEDLEEILQGTPIFLPVFTPYPSGPKKPLKKLSSVEAMGKNEGDWVHHEVTAAMRAHHANDKLVISLYHGVDIGQEWRHLPDDVKAIKNLNHRSLQGDMFDDSVRLVNTFIQRGCLSG